MDAGEECGESRIIGPVRRIVAVGQGRNTPRRQQYAESGSRRGWNKSVYYPVFVLGKEFFEYISQPENPNHPGHQAGRAVRHLGAHVDGIWAHRNVIEKDRAEPTLRGVEADW